jgi:hypothetical protein
LGDLIFNADHIHTEKLRIAIEMLVGEQPAELKETNQKDLVLYTRELDRRRGLDFPGTFPELHALLPIV